MTHRLSRIAITAILILLGVACWRLSLDAADRLERLGGVRHYRGLQKKGGDYDAMLESEGNASLSLSFALWGQQGGSVSDPVTKNAQEVEVLRVKGDTRLVLPVAETLAEDDYEGCLIDKKTALALYKNANAVGNKLRLGGREYTVRGVMDGVEGTVLVRAGEEDELSCVSAGASDGAFAQRHGLGQEAPNALYGDAARVLSRLPVLCLALIVLLWLFYAKRRHAAYPLRNTLLLCAIFAAITFMALYLLEALPKAYTPTRWSDFAQYTALATRLSAQVQQIFSMQKTQADIYAARLCAVSLLGLVSCICLVWAHGRARLLFESREDGRVSASFRGWRAARPLARP